MAKKTSSSSRRAPARATVAEGPEGGRNLTSAQVLQGVREALFSATGTPREIGDIRSDTTLESLGFAEGSDAKFGLGHKIERHFRREFEVVLDIANQDVDRAETVSDLAALVEAALPESAAALAVEDVINVREAVAQQHDVSLMVRNAVLNATGEPRTLEQIQPATTLASLGFAPGTSAKWALGRKVEKYLKKNYNIAIDLSNTKVDAAGTVGDLIDLVEAAMGEGVTAIGMPAIVSPKGTASQPATTGRMLVVMRPDRIQRSLDSLMNVAGLEMAASSNFSGQHGNGVACANVLLEKLGIAVVTPDPDQNMALMRAAADGSRPDIEHSEPEFMCYTMGPVSVDLEYLRGWRDATVELYERLTAGETTRQMKVKALSQANFTWGLQASSVLTSPFSGKGVKVAVLDTGFDLLHADFANRTIEHKSFIQGESEQDGHGHGTHCIGTACGPKLNADGRPRYGIAYESEIYAGKVLSNGGSGPGGGILSGIEWAVSHGCRVISMSLGSQGPVSLAYETAGERALEAGSLIIAAAGNESHRPGSISPVGRPANSVSIMAVAALDEAESVAWFSNGGSAAGGGQIDIAAAGVDVLSIAPGQTQLVLKSGTSMATPHVAGLAALWAQAVPDARGNALKALLLQNARRLPLLSTDVGSGWAQAPQQ